MVVQDVRGRYKSEGFFLSYSQEGPDGFDTMQWIYNQAWCNKKIGVTGSSYFASTAQAILVQNAPGLAAGIIRVGPGNYREDGAWRGGAFLLAHNVNYALSLALAGKEAATDPPVRSAIAAASAAMAFLGSADLLGRKVPLARAAGDERAGCLGLGRLRRQPDVHPHIRR